VEGSTGRFSWYSSKTEESARTKTSTEGFFSFSRKSKEKGMFTDPKKIVVIILFGESLLLLLGTVLPIPKDYYQWLVSFSAGIGVSAVFFGLDYIKRPSGGPSPK